MKKITITTCVLFILSTFAFSPLLAQNTHKFIGAKKCGMCHKKDKIGKQLKIWKKGKHFQAYKTLKTSKADAIAIEKGFKTKAVETPECLACHTTGHDVDASMLGKKFKIEDGIQCETCHGAGSNYKKKKIMKDHAKAVANGLTEYKNAEAIKIQCLTCHNDKSPTYKEFNFDKRWAEIAHPVPEKK